jgi:hypothetical protein
VPVRSRPRLPVPSTIPYPFYAQEGLSSEWALSIPYNNNNDMSKLRASAQLAKKILYMGGDLCKVSSNWIELYTCIVFYHWFFLLLIFFIRLGRPPTLLIAFYTTLLFMKVHILLLWTIWVFQKVYALLLTISLHTVFLMSKY